jgi:plasmid stability protein
MHRTQLILEEWQYQALRARAEREQRSISDVVREILSNALAKSPRRKTGLQRMQGIGENKRTSGRDHDRFLYDLEDEG